MTTKMHFSGEFVKKLSPLDRSMYILYYKQELEEEEKRKKNKPGMVAPIAAAPDTIGE